MQSFASSQESIPRNISDISHGRISHPSEVLHTGDEITVKVLKFDREKARISLGMRQLNPDPWESLSERYPPQSRVVAVLDCDLVGVTAYAEKLAPEAVADLFTRYRVAIEDREHETNGFATDLR